MQSGLDSLLWEDLVEIDRHIGQTRTTLNVVLDAIQAGLVGQPSRLDSKRLSRLVVLSEMIQGEMQQWAVDIEERVSEQQAFSRRNGKR